jgi:hypothetical protein
MRTLAFLNASLFLKIESIIIYRPKKLKNKKKNKIITTVTIIKTKKN